MAGFDIEELRAVVDRPYVVSLAWRERTDFIPGYRHVDVGMAPVGFQPLTSVELSLRLLGDVEHAFLDPELCDAEGYCSSPTQPEAFCRWGDPRGGLSVGAELTLRTADGALDVSVPVHLRSWQWAGFRVGFEADLSGVSGSLRLAPSRPGPHRGVLRGGLYLKADAVRGSLHPVIMPVNPGITDEWQHTPLEGRFPAEDDCGVSEAPADPNTPDGRALIRQVTELGPRVLGLIDTASPIDIRWGSPPPTSAASAGRRSSLLVSSSAVRATCGAADGTPGFEADVTLRTEDGRLDWTTTLRGDIQQQGAEYAELGLCTSRYLRADDAFFTDDVSGIDVLGSQGARVNFCTQVVESDALRQSQARFYVWAVPACDRDPRCAADAASCRCGGESIVARFETPPPPPDPPGGAP